MQGLASAIVAGQRAVEEAVVGEAGVRLQDVARFVYPVVGRSVVDWDAVERDFGFALAQTTWEYGREVGHLGAGDQIAGLAHLLETKAVGPGDKLVLSGLGQGFTFGCAVLEIVAEPQWS
ncbi:hypothetical protein A6A06_24825 [Streptomyces sp. CB02923]|uniref:3-oxoacyl-[acyl-carrier-protein] synthase III C-terminal domain-containing protein n=1 Tax=Streptomyces sp. CB02923 TaxID=1718985 RepID=UPI00093B8108|nr:3-oxoacyl-[acyl-carrier-protein] synthase III C-terminal domain-containing protein [Streptomyces sp. CB02923]OKH98849.1 hypothetical protein A6A06_24825 [Streptomyces sp. CB02923]